MQYSTLLLAAAATFGFVAAQNSSLPLPSGIQPCCNVNVGLVDEDLRSEWCRASQNTCPEICGGQGNIASGGNNCDTKTLEHTCECRNGTKPDLALYQQTVEGQMCRFWHGQCIDATNEDASLQFSCDTIRDNTCGNMTTKPESASTTSSSAITSRTSSAGGNGGGSEPTGTGGSAASTNSPAAAPALDAARNYGTPLFMGAVAAVFGLAL
ncbi:unnamed protein product [Periconia digitata]|uniref:DUF7707 domain-containing protein n=1 Tax=Periconia digitata TaxID=1303443 RepID=A0A9W4UT97_9PLEO|nr:unnamed protein product [Periconia digitata]